MEFASDNWAGAAPDVAAALAAEAGRVAPSYGIDDVTRTVEGILANLFERDVAAFFVATGTASNALALSACARPGGLVFCHADAHINTDEAGATEFLSDLKLIGLQGRQAKIAPQALAAAVERYRPNPNRHGQPVAVSLSQLTELGGAYSIPEVGALAAIARGAGLAVHMDGARFANAVAATGASPAELSWKAGVDILSLGGTKGGCWQAEAVIFFDRERARDFQYLRKRSGHLISKSRFVAAQFRAWLDGGRWLELAGHANEMARRLAEGIAAAGGRLAWPPDGNQVFAILPRAAIGRLRNAGATFYEWGAGGLPREDAPADDEALVRLVASFATTGSDVDRFVALVSGT